MKKVLLLILVFAAVIIPLNAQRVETLLKTGWQFAHGHGDEISAWQDVTIPHDWAITGPFSRDNDLQNVAVEQNGESRASEKTGRTGGLPFIGRGTYRTSFDIADTTARSTSLVFDGAMSNAHVFVNGSEVAFWPYGYNSFHIDISPYVKPGANSLVVELENFDRASRWYPGAGLYRNVRLLSTNKVHIPVWGTYLTTPHVSASEASVKLNIQISGCKKGDKITVKTDIVNPSGEVVASSNGEYVAHGQDYTQNFLVSDPQLWNPDSPALYTAVTRLFDDGRLLDEYSTRFGIRQLEYIPEKGFFLNGQPTKFRGVCNHHDLGPLGAAVNTAALRHQLTLLKDMGVNAIRTAHNMPAPELVALCDEMGLMLMIEPFDDWGYRPKSPNGYGAVFNDWAERDVTNMVQQFRNAPSVVMWSIGNEVPSQHSPDGIEELTMLQNLVHTLDPTRPVTCGMDQIGAVLNNGFAAALDIPSFNYKPQFYLKAYDTLPQKMILGSETASTVSSRGVYYFPVDFSREHNVAIHPENQSSSYDNETCAWSNTPDIDLLMDMQPWVLGQFIWTGFDYLGEPSPYDTDAWPSHSSLFGAIDLASIPKDRFYLYRSVWNQNSPTLHILPHWTWPGREGQTTPVFVYTSYPSAELFVNGVSQGRREKNDSTLRSRFRLMWNDVTYAPGTLRVVAYDENGNPVAEKSVATAGEPHHLLLTSSADSLIANGEDLAYVTVQVADKEGNIVPTDSRTVKFSVDGAGSFEATANGDPTSLRPFREPQMDLFSGACTAIIRASDTPGVITLRVSAPGLPSAILKIPSTDHQTLTSGL